MRERDLEEIGALNPTSERAALARSLSARYGAMANVFTVVSFDEPVGILGLIETRPGVVSLLFFATDAFGRASLPFTKWCKTDLKADLFAKGVHRIECLSLAGYEQMHAWLKLVGLQPEGRPLKAYGRNREDFIPFALVREDDNPAG